MDKKEGWRKIQTIKSQEEMFNYNRLTIHLFHQSINYIVHFLVTMINLSLSLSLHGFTTSWGIFLISQSEKCPRLLAKTRRKGEEWLVQSSNLRECTFISVYTVNSRDLVRHCVTRIFHRTGREMNGDKSFERDRSFALLFRTIFESFLPNISRKFVLSFLLTRKFLSLLLWNSYRAETG